jgi:hypothetical protein
MRTLVAVLLLLLYTTCGAQAPAQGPQQTSSPACTPFGTAHTRTTLYFGLTHPTGTISERRWRAFLRDQVTPRFPDGLTVWEAAGQWKRQDGQIAHERAKVLLLVHEQTPAVQSAIAAIISTYKSEFQQESVLWETAPVCAAF